MRPGAAAPDDPEEVVPLPEPAAPSRRASRAWDRLVSAPPPPPGARPPARNAAVGSDEERPPFEDSDDEDGRSVDADEGFDYDEPAAPSGSAPPARPSPSGGSPPADGKNASRLVLILSTHVDDFKGAGEAWYRQKLIEGLEKEFSTLKIKTGHFECVGVMHEQDPVTFEVWTHQHHYVPQIKEIPVDAKALVPDEEPADEDLTQLFVSLVGALAWLVLPMNNSC